MPYAKTHQHGWLNQSLAHLAMGCSIATDNRSEETVTSLVFVLSAMLGIELRTLHMLSALPLGHLLRPPPRFFFYNNLIVIIVYDPRILSHRWQGMKPSRGRGFDQHIFRKKIHPKGEGSNKGTIQAARAVCFYMAGEQGKHQFFRYTDGWLFPLGPDLCHQPIKYLKVIKQTGFVCEASAIQTTRSLTRHAGPCWGQSLSAWIPCLLP